MRKGLNYLCMFIWKLMIFRFKTASTDSFSMAGGRELFPKSWKVFSNVLSCSLHRKNSSQVISLLQIPFFGALLGNSRCWMIARSFLLSCVCICNCYLHWIEQKIPPLWIPLLLLPVLFLAVTFHTPHSLQPLNHSHNLWSFLCSTLHFQTHQLELDAARCWESLRWTEYLQVLLNSKSTKLMEKIPLTLLNFGSFFKKLRVLCPNQAYKFNS